MELNKIFYLKTVKTNKPGELHFVDNIDKICEQNSFIIKRIFLINNFYDINTNNNKRGLHANLNFDEIIIVNEGCIHIKIINKNKESVEFKLNKNECLYFNRGYWLEFTINNIDTSITVLANEILSVCISEYDFNKFCSW
jgi:hypothetical protein